MAERITAAEAAARLGVKRETLYAYVSRGLLESRTALDGKTSTFDPDEVDNLRTSRKRRTPGQFDVTILTSLTTVRDGRVYVRGRDLLTLAANGAGFERVATLLWTGALDESSRGVSWPADRALRAVAHRAQNLLPRSAPLIDRLRINVAIASANDDLRHDLRPGGVVRTAPGLVAAMVDGLLGAGTNGAGSAGNGAGSAGNGAGSAGNGAGNGSGGAPSAPPLAARLWPALTSQRPTPKWLRVLDAALVLLADHDLAASTFAARVAASTRADPYSVVSAGLGALGGPLHGAASRPVHTLLASARRGNVAPAVGEALVGGAHVPGFGHFLYPGGDPRATTLLELIRDASPPAARVAVCEEVIGLVRRRSGSEPNIDFALAALSFLTGMRPDAGEAIFAIARAAGWLAHALEEYGEAPLRFRPVGRYVGAAPDIRPRRGER